MDDLRRWYNGYELAQVGHVYAPFSVMQACQNRQVGSYWASSDAFDSLRLFIDMDFNGLREAVVQLLGGAQIDVDTGKFDNDMLQMRSADDVLTLLVHLGYLSYRGSRSGRGVVHVPNEEVRSELTRVIEESSHAEVASVVRESDALLRATWGLDGAEVARLVSQAHDASCSPLHYNDEQALRAVVKAAYISAVDHYVVIDEFPGGRGFADVAFLPRKGSSAPAMLVELKWNRSPEAALAQIRSRDHPQALREWGGPMLLVGITYDSTSKEHSCVIERV